MKARWVRAVLLSLVFKRGGTTVSHRADRDAEARRALIAGCVRAGHFARSRRTAPGYDVDVRPRATTSSRGPLMPPSRTPFTPPAFRRVWATIAATWLLATVLVARASSQVVRDDFWMPDGAAEAVAASNGIVYFGGSFAHVGPPTGGFARLDATTGAVLPPYAMVAPALGDEFGSYAVYAIAPDGNGGEYVGGDFARWQGQPRAHLVHLDANGVLLPFNPGTDGVVRALVFDASTNTLYVGGGFATLGGQPARTWAP